MNEETQQLIITALLEIVDHGSVSDETETRLRAAQSQESADCGATAPPGI